VLSLGVFVACHTTRQNMIKYDKDVKRKEKREKGSEKKVSDGQTKSRAKDKDDSIIGIAF